MKGLFFHYIPYGVVDLLLTIIIVSEFVAGRPDLIWANIPLLIMGIVSLNRKIRTESDDLDT